MYNATSDSRVLEMDQSFCVYEHWRTDKNSCFYVGKGKAKRAFSTESRNDRYGKTVSKLKRHGLAVEIRIFAEGLTEEDAFRIERERIAFWRAAHSDLTNQTDGGDGSSGYRYTPEQREKIAVKARGRILSPETRAKMAKARTGQKRTEETKEKMRQAALRVQSKSRKAVCQTEAGRQHMLRMSRGAAADPEVRRIRSENQKALWASPEYRARRLAKTASAIPAP